MTSYDMWRLCHKLVNKCIENQAKTAVVSKSKFRKKRWTSWLYFKIVRLTLQLNWPSIYPEFILRSVSFLYSDLLKDISFACTWYTFSLQNLLWCMHVNIEQQLMPCLRLEHPHTYTLVNAHCTVSIYPCLTSLNSVQTIGSTSWKSEITENSFLWQ